MQDKLTLRHTRARLLQSESQLKQLQWEHDQLEKQFVLVQKERDEIAHSFEMTLAYVCCLFSLFSAGCSVLE